MSRDLFGVTYPTTLMDPPWPEHGGGQIKRGADRHYPLVRRVEDIERIVKGAPNWAPATDAHLYMWVTNNYLVMGLELVALLGFRYVTSLAWAKMDYESPVGEPTRYRKAQAGIGQYFRGEHELLLFCVRGDGIGLRRRHTERRNLGTLLPCPVPRDPDTNKRVHSRKPDESYRLIEAASPGPYAEIFARRAWGPDWTVWGFDAPMATEESEHV